MLAIKRSFVMLPVHRVHVFDQQAAVQTLARFVLTVQHIDVGKILHERPDGNSSQVKSNRDKGMRCAPSDSKHDDGITSVECRHGIEHAPSDARLLAFVNTKVLGSSS